MIADINDERVNEIDKLIPLSENTLKKYKYIYKGLVYRNDLGYPCDYRIFKNGKNTGLVVKYYTGKMLILYGGKKSKVNMFLCMILH